MHTIKIPLKKVHTDLITEKKLFGVKEEIIEENNIKLIRTKNHNDYYSTIYFKDITDKNNYQNVQEIFIKELKKYLKIQSTDKILVIGLGNEKSTPDSLGPKVIDNILVTRYLFLLGEVEEGYINVCSFKPNVMGNTGIDSFSIINNIIENTKVNKIIIIDALKTNNFENLVKTIQITNTGITPGSGIGNYQKEITSKTINKDIIVIGVPTVIDISNTINKDNYIVTPTNIDYLIEKLSILIGNGINKTIHKNFLSTK